MTKRLKLVKGRLSYNPVGLFVFTKVLCISDIQKLAELKPETIKLKKKRNDTIRNIEIKMNTRSQ